MIIKSIKKYKKLSGAKVLYRADFNVPLDKGKVADEHKIIMHLPTIRYLLEREAKIILISHLGRPDGKYEKKLSLRPVAEKLEKILGKKIKFISEYNDFEAGSEVGKLKNKEILFLENLRFDPGEEKNSKLFAKKLSRYGNIYVNDAFAASHRRSASLDAIKRFLPSYAGLLLRQELENLNKILKPKKPLIIIMGGAKAQTKIPLIYKLHSKAHRILIGGALANNFLLAKKFEIGKSLHDDIGLKFAREFKSKKILLPVDVITADRKNSWQADCKSLNQVYKTDYIFDIGPKTIRLYSDFIKRANTIIWNGPMGMYENKRFRHGTLSIARVMASRSRGPAFGAAGGGETVDALAQTGMEEYVDWVSTGGGAMLSFLAGEKMPGLKGLVK